MSYVDRLLKKAHLLRCTRSHRSDVPYKYASVRRFIVRLASETFLNSLESELFNTLQKFVPEAAPPPGRSALILKRLELSEAVEALERLESSPDSP
jgi:hypothetical protein